jgi:hypothetical protein
MYSLRPMPVTRSASAAWAAGRAGGARGREAAAAARWALAAAGWGWQGLAGAGGHEQQPLVPGALVPSAHQPASQPAGRPAAQPASQPAQRASARTVKLGILSYDFSSLSIANSSSL